MSLGRCVSDILSEHGLQDHVLVSLTGDRRVASIVIQDVEAAPSVLRSLKRSRIASRRVSEQSWEVFSEQEDDDATVEASALIARWKKKVQDGGGVFRKASKGTRSLIAKSRKHKQTALKTAKQLAEVTARLAEQKDSPEMGLLAKALAATAATGDEKAASALLDRLAGKSVDPRRPVMKKARKRRRKVAAPPASLVRQAEDFLRQHAFDSALTSAQILRLGSSRGEAFEAYEGLVGGIEQEEALVEAWSLAAQSVSDEMAMEDEAEEMEHQPGPEAGFMNDLMSRGMSRNSSNNEMQAIFGENMGSVLDRHTASKEDDMRVAEQVIEHYASEKHPKKITETDVKSYLKSSEIDHSARKIYSVIRSVTANKEVKKAMNPFDVVMDDAPVKAPPKAPPKPRPKPPTPHTPPEDDPWKAPRPSVDPAPTMRKWRS